MQRLLHVNRTENRCRCKDRDQSVTTSLPFSSHSLLYTFQAVLRDALKSEQYNVIIAKFPISSLQCLFLLNSEFPQCSHCTIATHFYTVGLNLQPRQCDLIITTKRSNSACSQKCYLKDLLFCLSGVYLSGSSHCLHDQQTLIVGWLHSDT